MGIEKRLQLIMASNRLSASSFADRIGVQRSNVSHVLNGRNKPGYDFLLKVIQAFPKVNTHWLLTGDEKTEEVSSFREPPSDSHLLNDEPPMMYNESPVNTSAELKPSGKKIIKTIVFYDDFTFDAFLPSEQ